MLDLNQRSPPCKGGKERCRGLQAFAKPAYLSRFLFSVLLGIARHCARSGVRVVSMGYKSFQKPSVRYLFVLALLIVKLASRHTMDRPEHLFRG